MGMCWSSSPPQTSRRRPMRLVPRRPVSRSATKTKTAPSAGRARPMSPRGWYPGGSGKSSSVLSARRKRKVTTHRVAMIGSQTSTPATRYRRSSDPFFFGAGWPGCSGGLGRSMTGVLNALPLRAAPGALGSGRGLRFGPRCARARARLCRRRRPLPRSRRAGGVLLRHRGGRRHVRRLRLRRLRRALAGGRLGLGLRLLRGGLRLLAFDGEIALALLVAFEIGLVPAAALQPKDRRGHQLLHGPLAAGRTLHQRRIADLLHHLGVELAALALVFVERHGFELVVCGELPAAAIIAACSQASGGLVE